MVSKTRRSRKTAVRESPPTYSARRLLLDTHVWIWWQFRDRRLGKAARAAIEGSRDVRLSAASAWEIAIKRATGKLKLPSDADIMLELERAGFAALPISIAHAEAVRLLPAFHGDPFDRMLVAQARLEDLTLVTADDTILRYGVAAIDARE